MKPIDPRKGIIVSYPHSGLNWVRYCIEYISGLRTAGTKRIIETGELAVYRTHNVKRQKGPNSTECAFFGDDGRPLHYRVVLLLRDYRESFVRLAKTKPDYRATVENISKGRIFNFRNYFDNLRAYDDFEGNKLLIRYQNLVVDFDRVRTILAFLDLPREINGFDVEYHRSKSLELFDGEHLSYTKADLRNFRWHQESVDRDVLAALDRLLADEYPDLLRRYFQETVERNGQ